VTVELCAQEAISIKLLVQLGLIITSTKAIVKTVHEVIIRMDRSLRIALNAKLGIFVQEVLHVKTLLLLRRVDMLVLLGIIVLMVCCILLLVRLLLIMRKRP